MFRTLSSLPDGFPLRSFRTGVALMLGLTVALMLLTYQLERNIRSEMNSALAIGKAADAVDNQRTQLGRAIDVAVATGDAKAVAEYRSIEPELRRSLKQLHAQIPDGHIRSFANQMADADKQLVAAEYRALDLVQMGKLGEAQGIVASPGYKRLLRVYAAGLERIEDHAEEHERAIQSRLDLYLDGLVGISAASILLVGIAWLSFVRPAHRWGKALELARDRSERAAAELRQSQSELAARNRQLYRQARVDALTGLHTRLQLNEDVDNPWAGGSRQPLCALLCDIDWFKRYNQIEGHVAGDELLRQVAAALCNVSGGGERLYRIGGDQFLVLIRLSSAATATSQGEKLRTAVERARLLHPASRMEATTISVGIAILESDGEMHIERWLTRARDALAAAKAAGRNRVVGPGTTLAATG